MTTSPLRVAFHCSSPDLLEPWMRRLAERICQSDAMTLCGLITSNRPDSIAPKGLSGVWWRLEARLFGRTSPARCTAFEAERDRLPVIPATDADALSQLAADVIIDLSSHQGTTLTGPGNGAQVWMLDFLGPDAMTRSVNAILSRPQLMTLGLWRQTPDTTRFEKLAEATVTSKFMVGANHLFACEKAVTLIDRELRRMVHDRQTVIGSADQIPQHGSVSLVQALRYGFNFARNAGTRVLHKIGSKLKLRPGMFYLRTITGNPLTFAPGQTQIHKIPENEFYADPFLWERDGQTYCFFEALDYNVGRGYVAAGRFENGQLVDIRKIISENYHFSFPFVFEHDGTFYMMPETTSARRLELWRCEEFPYKWTRDRTILDDVILADTTIVEIDGQWWLFTNQSDDPFEDSNSELHLYRISGPDLTELEPHPLNPVVFDARVARNGGRVISLDGQLYRPSQNNSHGLYGYGLNLMRIDQVSMQDYQETQVREILSTFEKGLIGCHHLDVSSDLIVIDVRQQVGGWPG